MDFYVKKWRAYRHLQDLIRFRSSGMTLDAGNDWLDKEISDIKAELAGGNAVEKKQSPGLGPGRLQALQIFVGSIIPRLKLLRKGAGRFARFQGRYSTDKLWRDRRDRGNVGHSPHLPSSKT